MSSHAIERLEKIMNELREQCPWDRKQTIHTLRQLTIEECHELADVITDENWKGIQEELGDILLHIIFYTKMGVRYYANLHFFLLFLAAFFTTVFVSVLGSFFGEVSKFFKSVSDKARDLKKS